MFVCYYKLLEIYNSNNNNEGKEHFIEEDEKLYVEDKV
jgi:hypothetical protein